MRYSITHGGEAHVVHRTSVQHCLDRLERPPKATAERTNRTTLPQLAQRPEAAAFSELGPLFGRAGRRAGTVYQQTIDGGKPHALQ